MATIGRLDTALAGGRLVPPQGGATVRMYRIGHGDCFLIALAGTDPDRPAYVLIDCGYKPGSTQLIRSEPPTVDEIAADLIAACGGRVDVAVITHEHQDHVNAITAKRFDTLEIGEVWLAWTEDPTDDLANSLRKKFGDELAALVAARHGISQLAEARATIGLSATAETDRVAMIDTLLEFELGNEDLAFAVPMSMEDKAFAASANKTAMSFFKGKAKTIRYLRPHEKILPVPQAATARAFALGPPRDAAMLKDLDPTGDEEFGFGGPATHIDFQQAAREATGLTDLTSEQPFAAKYRVPIARLSDDPDTEMFFAQRYGEPALAQTNAPSGDEIGDAEEFRRINGDWLGAADELALKMNDQTNNASLVLAFELQPGGKVLLFAADAQRGNWLSWDDGTFPDGDKTLAVRDLLGRTVLYKVGHHGSHNATINGGPEAERPCLGWLALGALNREFTAMITAVRPWAETQKGWDHPQAKIKEALLAKADHRVFQTDTDADAMTAGQGPDWDAFRRRSRGTRLYFDLDID